jgi:cytochrome c oxidase assembly protein subunit 15
MNKMTKQKIRGFQKLSLITTLATFFLIFVGGLVRVTGAGLGCPDWPKCFGRWIPPLSVQDLPAGFDTQSFNVTLAWIEYINRLIGVIVGFLILSTAVLALLYFRKHKRIVIPAVIAVLLVAFQGWFGSIVVSSSLEPLMVSLHLLLALVIVSLLIFVTQSAYYLREDSLPASSVAFKSLRNWIAVIWILAIIQITLGTQVRSQVEFILREYPLLLGFQLVGQIGIINYIHSILGLIFMAASVLVAIMLLRIPEFRLYGVFVVLLPLIQILIGSGMEIFGIPAILQVFHLWFASLIIGALLIIFTQLTYMEGEQ